MRLPLDDDFTQEIAIEADNLSTYIIEVATDIESIAEMMSDLIVWPESLGKNCKPDTQTWH